MGEYYAVLDDGKGGLTVEKYDPAVHTGEYALVENGKVIGYIYADANAPGGFTVREGPEFVDYGFLLLQKDFGIWLSTHMVWILAWGARILIGAGSDLDETIRDMCRDSTKEWDSMSWDERIELVFRVMKWAWNLDETSLSGSDLP